jgi:hypothetical protein
MKQIISVLYSNCKFFISPSIFWIINLSIWLWLSNPNKTQSASEEMRRRIWIPAWSFHQKKKKIWIPDTQNSPFFFLNSDRISHSFGKGRSKTQSNQISGTWLSMVSYLETTCLVMVVFCEKAEKKHCYNSYA